MPLLDEPKCRCLMSRNAAAAKKLTRLLAGRIFGGNEGPKLKIGDELAPKRLAKD
jgi:hypothetical protein